MYLRQTNIHDKSIIKSIYLDSINSIDVKIYSPQQKFAWCSQAWENPEFNNAITKGKGWIVGESSYFRGFAIRYPKNKLSLFYCRADSKRKGIGTMLLNKIEQEAKNDNISSIKTEASLISYRLLLKRDWKIIRKENIIIKNTIFNRYKMIKNLT
ncbi:MAG: GNAT family N-acetyltransferase [Prochlorococcus sp. SP3034]|nr:GNAT family N-acetyltransferase [Prochlorococcus sp. SP3034]|tara:strand:- start:10035 stop:10499 length:465 start_codon:yes stop_codon:yes gene_type:complete